MNPTQTLDLSKWDPLLTADEQRSATEQLEKGYVLYCPTLSFELMENEKKFLSPKYVDTGSKNVSYQFLTDTLRGAQATSEEKAALKQLLKRFSEHTQQLIKNLFPHYQSNLTIARTSFRPVQVSHRKTSYRKDDKRLHVDAFPASPNQGQRILRVFSNINLNGEDRVWKLGEPFEQVARHFLPRIGKPFPGMAQLLQWMKITKSYRTEYDHIMLQIHDRMKGDETYQKTADQVEMHFPPHTTWIVQTDQVSHAALSGQHLLEQTFHLPIHAMQNESQSPLRILERIKGQKLV